MKYTTLFFVLLGVWFTSQVSGQSRPHRLPLEGFSYNISKLAQYKDYLIGFRSQSYYLKENSLFEGIAYAGFQKNGFGIAYTYSGYSVHHKQYAQVLYTHSFGDRVYFGLGFGYKRENFSTPKKENYRLPPIQGLVIDLSISAEISSELIISSCFFSRVLLFRAKKRNLEYGLGIDADYLITENLSISAGASLETDQKVDFHLNFSYLLAKHYFFYINSGIPSFVNSFGFGYQNHFLKGGVGLSYQMPLGIGIECGILWKFGKRKE